MPLKLERYSHTSAALVQDGVGDGHGIPAQELLDALLAAKAELSEAAWAAARIDYPGPYGNQYRLEWPWHRGAPWSGE